MHLNSSFSKCLKSWQKNGFTRCTRTGWVRTDWCLAEKNCEKFAFYWETWHAEWKEYTGVFSGVRTARKLNAKTTTSNWLCRHNPQELYDTCNPFRVSSHIRTFHWSACACASCPIHRIWRHHVASRLTWEPCSDCNIRYGHAAWTNFSALPLSTIVSGTASVFTFDTFKWES